MLDPIVRNICEKYTHKMMTKEEKGTEEIDIIHNKLRSLGCKGKYGCIIFPAYDGGEYMIKTHMNGIYWQDLKNGVRKKVYTTEKGVV